MPGNSALAIGNRPHAEVLGQRCSRRHAAPDSGSARFRIGQGRGRRARAADVRVGGLRSERCRRDHRRRGRDGRTGPARQDAAAKHRLDLTASARHHRGARPESAMTVRNLDHLCKPRSVVLIGASDDPRSVGGVLAAQPARRRLRRAGSCRSTRASGTIEGARCLPHVASLPAAPDLAVIATPPATVPGDRSPSSARAARGRRGDRPRASASAADGGALRQAMLDAARPAPAAHRRPQLHRLHGPGATASTRASRPASAQPATSRFCQPVGRDGDRRARLGSGARGIGFSHVVSLGDMADVDFGDLLDYLAHGRRDRARSCSTSRR